MIGDAEDVRVVGGKLLSQDGIGGLSPGRSGGRQEKDGGYSGINPTPYLSHGGLSILLEASLRSGFTPTAKTCRFSLVA